MSLLLLSVSSLVCMDESTLVQRPVRVKTQEMRKFESKCKEKYREKAVQVTRSNACSLCMCAITHTAVFTLLGTYCLQQYLSQPCQPCNCFNAIGS